MLTRGEGWQGERGRRGRRTTHCWKKSGLEVCKVGQQDPVIYDRHSYICARRMLHRLNDVKHFALN